MLESRRNRTILVADEKPLENLATYHQISRYCVMISVIVSFPRWKMHMSRWN
jgi:hypothetical protein